MNKLVGTAVGDIVESNSEVPSFVETIDLKFLFQKRFLLYTIRPSAYP